MNKHTGWILTLMITSLFGQFSFAQETREGCNGPLHGIETQVNLLNIINQSAKKNAYTFVKDVPSIGYKITTETNAEQFPDFLRNELGRKDQTSYPQGQYIASNQGSYINLQWDKSGSDFYIPDFKTIQDKYVEVSLEEAMKKNPKLVKNLRTIPALSTYLDHPSAIGKLFGILKVVPTPMSLMSELGFRVEDEITIQSPWGDTQMKPAGQDAYLVYESLADNQAQVYMVNVDPTNGYPSSYIPLPKK